MAQLHYQAFIEYLKSSPQLSYILHLIGALLSSERLNSVSQDQLSLFPLASELTLFEEFSIYRLSVSSIFLLFLFRIDDVVQKCHLLYNYFGKDNIEIFFEVVLYKQLKLDLCRFFCPCLVVGKAQAFLIVLKQDFYFSYFGESEAQHSLLKMDLRIFYFAKSLAFGAVYVNYAFEFAMTLPVRLKLFLYCLAQKRRRNYHFRKKLRRKCTSFIDESAFLFLKILHVLQETSVVFYL